MKKPVLVFNAFSFLCLFCQAQLPVNQEPMHHKILDNGHVRLLDVHIPPGDTSQFHIHATPSVFVILTVVKTGSQVIQEEEQAKFTVPDYGDIYFEGFYRLPRIHRVWNRDTIEFHVMDIELTNKTFSIIDSPIRNQAFHFLFEEKPVRAYRLTLGDGMKITLDPRKADVLVIRLTGPDNTVIVNKKLLLTKGDFIYIPSGKKLEIKSEGNASSAFAFFELK